MRPDVVIVVAGTATEIGKTFVAAGLARELRARGRSVSARKPVQSFSPRDPSPTDAEVLAEVTGERAEVVCPPHRSYAAPLAPPMAADALGEPPPLLADLAALHWPDRVDLGLVELVGGVRSPIADDGDGVDLTHALEPDLVVLVADAGLGTINAVRLSAGALVPFPVVVHLNRYDERDALHVRNRDWLVGHDRYVVATSIPDLTELLVSRLW